jgi:predicted ATPase
MERFEQAVELHHYLVDTYQSCGYDVHTLHPGTLEERAAQLFSIISQPI